MCALSVLPGFGSCIEPVFCLCERAFTLHAGAEELLHITDDLVENKCCMNLLLAILSLLTEPSLVCDLKLVSITVSDVAFFLFLLGVGCRTDVKCGNFMKNGPSHWQSWKWCSLSP